MLYGAGNKKSEITNTYHLDITCLNKDIFCFIFSSYFFGIVNPPIKEKRPPIKIKNKNKYKSKSMS